MKKENTAVLFLVLLICGVVLIGFLGFIGGKYSLRTSPNEKAWQSLPEVNIFDKKAIEERKDLILKNGKDISLSGTLEVIIYDDFENGISANQYFLRNGKGKKYNVYFNGEPGLVSGIEINVNGMALENLEGGIVVTDFDIVSEPIMREGEENPNLGEQKTALVLVTFLDNPTEPITISQAQTMMNEVNDYVTRVSYGKSWLNYSIYGYYGLDIGSEVCSYPVILNEVLFNQEIAQDINWQEVNRLFIGSDFIESCGELGQGSVGSFLFDTADGQAFMSYSYLFGTDGLTPGVAAHELGHNFGLWHAEDYECDNKVVDDFCETVGYGDHYDIMGNYLGAGHYNSIFKESSGFFNYTNVLEIESNGEYIIYPLEISTPDVQALKVPAVFEFEDWESSTSLKSSHYYIEYRRQPILGNLTNLDGVMIRLNSILLFNSTGLNLSFSSFLLDFSPHENSEISQYEDSLDVVLREGGLFYDERHGMTFSVVSVEEDYAVVSVNFPECGDNIIEGDEECDDSNTITNDCCTNNCTTARCGDGICANSVSCNENAGCDSPSGRLCEADCGPCISSFLAGTKIITANEKEKNIENIKAGDLVLSFNEKTNSLAKSKVLQLFEHDANDYYIINGEIKVTAEHPIWANGEWKKVRELKIGDALTTKDKTHQSIYSISYVKEKIKVYNLKVENTQTYFAEGILVHNKPPCREGEPCWYPLPLPPQ